MAGIIINRRYNEHKMHKMRRQKHIMQNKLNGTIFAST